MFLRTISRQLRRQNSNVSEAILDLLWDGRIEDLFSPPEILNVFSVFGAEQPQDNAYFGFTTHPHLHVHKQKFKCEGLQAIQSVFAKGFIVFSFDIKSEYNHLDVFPVHRKYLSFS